MNDLEARERAAIVRDLASPDDEMRRLALERVVTLPSAEAIPHLVEGLGDGSWRVRKTAVERLVACAERERVVDALMVSLADGENPGRRNSAVEALVACGSRACPALIDALSSEDVDVRKLVVDTLAGIADCGTEKALIPLLRDPDVNVRASAADALGVIGGDSTPAALAARLDHAGEDRLVQLSALRALARLEAPMQAADLEVVMEDSLLQPAAFALLGQSDDEAALESLLKGLSATGRSVREAAMEGLLQWVARAGPEAQLLGTRIREAARASEQLVEKTVERLPDADLAARMVMMQFLGLVAHPDSVLPILEAARDEALTEVAFSTLQSMGEPAEAGIAAGWERLDAESRRDAAELLGRTQGRRGDAVLLLALGGIDGELRATAARSLGRRGCMEAMPRIVERMESAALTDDIESEEELRALVNALVELPGESAESAASVIALLEERIAGATDGFRLSAATVVGQIGGAEDAELVTRLLKDPSDGVRRAAVEALARLEAGAISEPLRLALGDESARVRVAAAGALGGARSPSLLQDLAHLMRDDDAAVRAAAVRAAGEQYRARSDSDVREPLLALVADALEDESRVAMAAVETLRELGGERAAEILVHALARSEPELVQAAIACIGADGLPATLQELLPLVAHTSWMVRAEAIQVLADRRVVQAIPPILRRLETEQDAFVRDTILRALKRLEA